MLLHLRIRNLAVVKACELDFAPGLTVLTGETGAGKSILVDALGLVLGDRADRDQIRTGEERAEVAAHFELSEDRSALAWLREQGLDGGYTCWIRRILSREGRSRAYINGYSAPIQTLREIGQRLVDIHTQGEHHSLLRTGTQRELLDAFGGVMGQLQRVADAFYAWREAEHELETLEQSYRNSIQRREVLREQVQELEGLGLETDEFDRLTREHQRLNSITQLVEGAQALLTSLYEAEDSTIDQLDHAQSRLSELAKIDPDLEGLQKIVANASAFAEETADQLRHYLHHLDIDPERLATVEQRLGSIHTLCRKHHTVPERLAEKTTELRAELEELGGIEPRWKSVQERSHQCYKIYWQAASTLTEQRRVTAERLEKRVTQEIQALGMPDSLFEVAIETTQDPAQAAAAGLDRIEYRIRTHPGEPPKPLTKVASGGELSRLSLALQAVLAKHSQFPTLILDEIDLGVSGAAAEMVGRKMQAISQYSQVLAITHLGQVAAQGHQHLRITKGTEEGLASTQIEPLDEEERVEEIARILGSRRITESTRASAREMLATARS